MRPRPPRKESTSRSAGGSRKAAPPTERIQKLLSAAGIGSRREREARVRRLLDEVGSPYLKVTMDAANLFHAGELARMSEVLDKAFALVGKEIVMAHAKDVSHDGDAGHEPAGYGKLDYDRYLSLLHAYGFKGPLLLHGLSAAQVPGCVAFLREKLARVASAASKPGPLSH